MNTLMIINQLRLMAAQAAVLSELTEPDLKTAVFFEGKKSGFEVLQDKNEYQVVIVRDLAQSEAVRHLTEQSDLLKYQYFCGILAAANEVMGLHIMNRV